MKDDIEGVERICKNCSHRYLHEVVMDWICGKLSSPSFDCPDVLLENKNGRYSRVYCPLLISVSSKFCCIYYDEKVDARDFAHIVR